MFRILNKVTNINVAYINLARINDVLIDALRVKKNLLGPRIPASLDLHFIVATNCRSYLMRRVCL